MGLCSQRRLESPLPGLLAVALGLIAFSITPSPALAQAAADAGAPRHAATKAEAPPSADDQQAASALKSIPNANNVISDRVRARLQERAAGRHPSEVAAREPSAEHAPPRAPSAAPSVAQSAREHASSEALRRGGAPQGRVRALDTADGVTVLSNRLSEAPTPQLAAVAPSAPEVEHIEATEVEQHASVDDSTVTETRSLRALSSRRDVPKARESNLGAGWLLWPFVLLLATGAVIGTLWFSKKTQ